MSLRRVLLLTVSAASVAAAAPALAQTSGVTPNQGSDDGSATVGEVIVTAQRRTENLQDVPLAVTAFSERQLEAAQIDDTTDLVRFTPSVTGGLNTGTGSALSFFIRGLGSTEQVATFDVPVASYVDEIYFARQSANAISLFDIERVEVLRGPQGTLFGRNTTGGAVSIVTRKPAKEFGFFAEGSYGSYDRKMIRGSVDVPLSDTLFTKLSAFKVKDHGYARSLTTGERLNAEDAWGVRGAVRWLPTEAATWDVSLDYIDQSKTTLGSSPVDPKYTTRSGLRYHDCDNDTIERLYTQRLGNCANVRTGGLTSNLSLDVGDLGSVSVITGYRQINQNFALDFLNGTGPLGGFALANQVRSEQFTQEVKLVGERGPLKYVAGVFYLDEKSKTTEIDLFGTLMLANWIMRNSTESYAVYAQGDFSLTDQLTLTAGARWTHEEKDFGYEDAVRSFYATGIVVASAPATRPTNANVVARGIPLKQSEEKFTPRVAVSYKIDDDKMIFASATNGFKSGGWNTRVTNVNAVTIFGPEKAWSYELGARTDWMDNRLRINATLYHEDVKDLQLLSGFSIGGTTQFVTRNAGDLSATGLELEVNATPVPGLDIFASGSISDKKYKNIPPALGAGGVPCTNSPEPLNCTTERDDPVRFPDKQATVGASYRVPLGGLGGSLTFNGAVSFSSSYWTSTYNDNRTVTAAPFGSTTTVTKLMSLTPSTEVVNVGVVYRSADDHWEAALECSNCTKEYFVTSSLFNIGYYNDPRRISFRVKYTY